MILRRKKRTLTAEDIHTELDRICKGAPEMDTLIRQEFIGFLPNQTQSANVPDNLPGHIPCPAQLQPLGPFVQSNDPRRALLILGLPLHVLFHVISTGGGPIPSGMHPRRNCARSITLHVI